MYISLDSNKLTPADFIPEGRKHHAGTTVGKYLLFHGGLDTSGHLLNELIMFDVSEWKWFNVKIGIVDEELLSNKHIFQKWILFIIFF